MHIKGIVHADIKLANVVVTSRNIPKIIDFDLSVAFGESKGGRGTS